MAAIRCSRAQLRDCPVDMNCDEPHKCMYKNPCQATCRKRIANTPLRCTAVSFVPGFKLHPNLNPNAYPFVPAEQVSTVSDLSPNATSFFPGSKYYHSLDPFATCYTPAVSSTDAAKVVLIPQDAFSCVTSLVNVPGTHVENQGRVAKPKTGASRLGLPSQVTTTAVDLDTECCDNESPHEHSAGPNDVSHAEDPAGPLVFQP